MEEKDITLNEYCALHNVDRRTHQLMNRIALHKARQLGLSEPTYSTVFPQGYWKRLYREAQRPDGNSIRYETARNFLRKYRERDNISPDSFFQYMQEHYKGFPSRRRVGPDSDSLVFLYSDLREAFHALEKAATQPLLDAPPQPVETVKPRPTPAFSAAEGQGLLGFVLGALSGAAVAVACVLCCF